MVKNYNKKYLRIILSIFYYKLSLTFKVNVSVSTQPSVLVTFTVIL
jgi:hypothetical protein